MEMGSHRHGQLPEAFVFEHPLLVTFRLKVFWLIKLGEVLRQVQDKLQISDYKCLS
jgi:hypothetical protein